MKPWWKNAIPHEDIRKGRFDPSVFAIDLGEVTEGGGAEEYRDPVDFFKRTYMTKGLRELILKILSTLYAGHVEADLQRISPVLQLVTPFGGGKTHSLLALYHITKNFSKVKSIESVGEILEELGLESLPETNVASIDGTHLDPLEGEEKPEGMTVKTVWGELAYQLGGPELYEEIKKHDKKMVAPGKRKLKHILEKASPCLIILDEILEYIVKARGVEVGRTDLGGQTMAFIQELTGVVSTISKDEEHNATLVVTLPSSHLERYDEAAEKDYSTLKKVTARIELRHSLVEGPEIYEIIRRRLLDEIKDVREIEKISDEFHENLKDLRDSVPKEFRDEKYREKIKGAYPFHPELIDVLYEKWAALSGFQRTRGALRFLALVVSDLYNKNDPNPLIMPGLINLGNRMIQDELLTYLDEGYSSVVDSDIAGPDSKCALLDSEFPSEFEKYKIATRIATLVFMHSVGEDGGLGISQRRIKATTVTPELDAPIVSEAIELVRAGRLWYLYEKGENLYFGKDPGLNRVITEKKDDLDDDRVFYFIHQKVARIVGDGNSYIAPEDPSKVPDTEALKFVFLSPMYSYGEEEKEKTEKYCSKILNEHLRTSPRKRKNTLVFVLADSDRVGKILSHGRELLALKEINETTEIKESLSETQKKDLENKLKNIDSKFSNELQIAYSHILIPSEDGFDHYSMGLSVVRRGGNVKEFVEGYLKKNEILLNDVEPSVLVSRTWPEDKNYVNTKDVYEAFLTYLSVEMIVDKEVVRRSIAKGVSTGVFGYGIADYPEELDDIKFGDSISSDEVELSEKAWLIQNKIAEKMKPTEEEGKPEAVPVPPIPAKGIKEAPTRRRVSVQIDASNVRSLTDLYRGVIKPLKDEVEDTSVNIYIDAHGELNEETLKEKVEETLKQLRCKYKIEEE